MGGRDPGTAARALGLGGPAAVTVSVGGHLPGDRGRVTGDPPGELRPRHVGFGDQLDTDLSLRSGNDNGAPGIPESRSVGGVQQHRVIMNGTVHRPMEQATSDQIETVKLAYIDPTNPMIRTQSALSGAIWIPQVIGAYAPCPTV